MKTSNNRRDKASTRQSLPPNETYSVMGYITTTQVFGQRGPKETPKKAQDFAKAICCSSKTDSKALLLKTMLIIH